MTRLPYRLAFVLVAALIAGAVPAIAQAAGALTPVIDSAAPRTGFKGRAIVRGHLEGSNLRGWIVLSKRKPGGDWFAAATREVHDRYFRFRLDGLKMTADYRLTWVEGRDANPRRSDPIEIAVRPKLAFKASPSDVIVGSTLRLSGTLYPKVRGRTALVQQRVDGSWLTLDKVGVGDGAFATKVGTKTRGHKRFRLRFSGDAFNLPARRGDRVRAYGRELATWYGPGFYGNRTACGHTFSSEIVGVAHRTLPCGASVRLMYKGRTMTVPVIDRGPYGDSNWDLSQETAERLGFSGKDAIGVLY